MQTAPIKLKVSLEIANSNPVGSGARAIGLANAFIAIADYATAASWNPAGQFQLERPEASFAFEFLGQHRQIISNTHPKSEGSDRFTLSDLNYLSIVYPRHIPKIGNVVISLNYLKLFRYDKELNVPVQDSTLTPPGTLLVRDFKYNFDQDGSFSVWSPTIAMDITQSLSLGLSLNIWNPFPDRCKQIRKNRNIDWNTKN